MNLTDSLLPADLLFFANFIWLAIGIHAVRVAPWRALLTSPKLQHVFMGASIALFLIWIFEVGVRPALGFHLLGVTVYTLMFGWSLGVIGASLIMLAVTVMHGDWAALCAAVGGDPARRFAFTTRGSRPFGQVAWQPGDWLVFGRESAGLPPAWRSAIPATQHLRLPMRPGQRSLNLSNAVAVAVFEAWRQQGYRGSD